MIDTQSFADMRGSAKRRFGPGPSPSATKFALNQSIIHGHATDPAKSGNRRIFPCELLFDSAAEKASTVQSARCALRSLFTDSSGTIPATIFRDIGSNFFPIS